MRRPAYDDAPKPLGAFSLSEFYGMLWFELLKISSLSTHIPFLQYSSTPFYFAKSVTIEETFLPLRKQRDKQGEMVTSLFSRETYLIQ